MNREHLVITPFFRIETPPLGFALAAVQLLENGGYLAMNGQIFDPLQSIKNVEKSRFESS